MGSEQDGPFGALINALPDTLPPEPKIMGEEVEKLIDRLRLYSEHQLLQGYVVGMFRPGLPSHHLVNDIAAAAAEIESLRATLTRERERCAGLAEELAELWDEFPQKHKSDDPHKLVATFNNICVEKRITARAIADKIRAGDEPTRLSRPTSAEGE